jgi:hypothetical protein
MKTKIVSFGDSFVFGSELKNNDTGCQSWIGQIATQLGVDYKTLAVPGCGNENISRQILTYFSTNPSNDVLAVINWTWGARWDFYVPQVETWTTLGLSCVPSTLAPLTGEIEATKVLEFYNKYPGHSTLWDKFRTLQTIHSSQQYLKNLGVPTIQTCMDIEMWDTTWHAPDYIRTLQDLTKGPLESFEGKTFLDWSRDKGFAVTNPGWHPLEQAHAGAADFWIDRYRQALAA